MEKIVHGRIRERCFGTKPAKPDAEDAEEISPEPAPRGAPARQFRRRKKGA